MAKTKRTTIDPDTYGSADYVTEIPYLKEVSWGGLTARLYCGPDWKDHPRGTILIWARKWKGAQPRLVLDGYDEGYDDWRTLLDAAPEVRGVMRVVGAAAAARNAWDQWLTHGPSPLLGGKKETFETHAP